MLWDNVAEYRAREQRWDRIQQAGLPLDDPREDAAECVFEMLFDARVSMGFRESGAIHIKDSAALAARLGLGVKQLMDHPLAFVEDDVLIAPWEVTELVVMTAAHQNPRPVLEYVANEERKAQYEAIHGNWLRGGRRNSGHHIDPEICIQIDNERGRPCREVLRSWCGIEATDRFDELIELRKEIRRVGDVAQSAIDALRSAGRASEVLTATTRTRHTRRDAPTQRH